MAEKTMKDVRRLVKDFGASIDKGSKSRAGTHYNIDAPNGMTWCCESGLHCLVLTVWDDFDNTEEYEDVIQRMRYGVEKCDTEDCDVCGEVDSKPPSVKQYKGPVYYANWFDSDGSWLGMKVLCKGKHQEKQAKRMFAKLPNHTTGLINLRARFVLLVKVDAHSRDGTFGIVLKCRHFKPVKD